MKPFVGNIEKLSESNTNFRKVIFTGKLQLVLMSLKPNEEIGGEIHKDVDQFFRIEEGVAVFVLNKEDVFIARSGDAVVVPAGTHHNIMNKSGTTSLKLYTIYSPPKHKDKLIQKTKKEADASSE
jgi:mannose-6-phosphate isomerase-like protein (cupin superfamily)